MRFDRAHEEAIQSAVEFGDTKPIDEGPVPHEQRPVFAPALKLFVTHRRFPGSLFTWLDANCQAHLALVLGPV